MLSIVKIYIFAAFFVNYSCCKHHLLVLQMVSARNFFLYCAAQEDNITDREPIGTQRLIISIHSPTPDVIEAVPIETQLLINTDESHRSRPLTLDPIETQAPTETVEPRRSCPPTPDTTANVDGQ
jgi:hypothetical protein